MSVFISNTECAADHLIIGRFYATGSPKKHENWKTTWGLLIDILIRMKSPSIKTNIQKNGVMITVFY